MTSAVCHQEGHRNSFDRLRTVRADSDTHRSGKLFAGQGSLVIPRDQHQLLCPSEIVYGDVVIPGHQAVIFRPIDRVESCRQGGPSAALYVDDSNSVFSGYERNVEQALALD